VPRLPSAILAVGLALSGLVLIGVGVVLHAIARRFQEIDQKLQVLLTEPQTRSNRGGPPWVRESGAD
jgi:multisubunit Na+/H+ antiporter MnhB subunit